MTLRLVGFFTSLILTISAYFVILYPAWFHLTNPLAVVTIYILALLQSLAQLICFINLWKEKGPLWNLYVFLSTLSIIFVVVFFSIWIMDHLNKMMPH